jgi:hypothetical protein
MGYMEGEIAQKAWVTLAREGLAADFRVSTSQEWQHDVEAFPWVGDQIPASFSHPPLHLRVGASIALDEYKQLPHLATRTYKAWIQLLA